MSMNIQRGKVGYKGVDNYSCFFGAVGDKVYYFVDPVGLKLYYETDNLDVGTFKLPNGNFVATSLLNEVVDLQIKAVNIGIINENGDVVLPLENRKIVKINGDSGLLLVERAVPVSQSVLDAVEMRNDPSSATQLVSTTATIKDQITAAMGEEVGQYLFNDMLSEATITDYDGNNLLNGEYYSFICMSTDGKKFALSKNLVSTVMLFDSESKTLTPAAQQEEIDVTATGVDGAVVEDALAASDEVVSIPDAGGEPVADAGAPAEESGDMFDISVPAEDTTMTLPSADELNAFTVGDNDAAGELVAGETPETVESESVSSEEPVAEETPVEGAVDEALVAVGDDDALMPEVNQIPEDAVAAEEPVVEDAPVVGEVPAVDAVEEGEALVAVGDADALMPEVNPIPEDVVAAEEPVAEDALESKELDEVPVGEIAPEEVVVEEEPVAGGEVVADGEIAPEVSGEFAQAGDGYSIPTVEEDVVEDALGSMPEESAETEVDAMVAAGTEENAPEADFDTSNYGETGEDVQVEGNVAGGEDAPVSSGLDEPEQDDEFAAESENLFDVNPESEVVPQDDYSVSYTPVTELESIMNDGPRAIDPLEVASKVDKDGDGILDSEGAQPMDLFKEKDVPEDDIDLGDIPLGTRDVNNNQYIDSASELMMPASDRDYVMDAASSYGYDDYYPQYSSDSDSALMQKVATTLRSLINNDKQHRNRIAEEARANSDLRSRLVSVQRENEELRYRLEEQRGQIAELRRQVQGSDEIRRLLSESQEVLNSDGRGYYRRAA